MQKIKDRMNMTSYTRIAWKPTNRKNHKKSNITTKARIIRLLKIHYPNTRETTQGNQRKPLEIITYVRHIDRYTIFEGWQTSYIEKLLMIHIGGIQAKQVDVLAKYAVYQFNSIFIDPFGFKPSYKRKWFTICMLH